MAQMAFQVQSAGILGGVADLVIGIKSSSNVRIYSMVRFGSATGASHITTRRPFTIHDDPILATLTNETVDFQVSGIQAMWGDLSVGFKVYRSDGTVGYDETRMVATRGTSTGGFSRSAMSLSLVDPTSSMSRFWAGMLNLT